MEKIAIKLLMSVFIIQIQILGTDQVPLETGGTTLTVDGGKIKYTVIELGNKTGPGPKNCTTDDGTPEILKGEALEKLREQIILARRHQHRIFAHDPEDVIFMLTALILLCFHLFFMDIFIRLTRTRFLTNNRYHYLSTLHLFLAFLVCAIYFLLILLHYRDSQYCG